MDGDNKGEKTLSLYNIYIPTAKQGFIINTNSMLKGVVECILCTPLNGCIFSWEINSKNGITSQQLTIIWKPAYEKRPQIS